MCVLHGVKSLDERCFKMIHNITFNFSDDEALQIIIEQKGQARNVDQTTEYLLVFAYVVLIILGLAANLAVTFVVIRRPQMHTARNLFIANLTITDMTLCIICMPFTLLMIIRHQWTMGEMLCKLVPLFQGTNILVSVGTITVIALDRYVTIVHGHVGTDRTRVICSIVSVWILSLIAVSPIYFYQVVEPVRFEEMVLYESCIESWPSQTMKLMYSTAILLVQAVIPALVVGCVHFRISSHLHAHAKTQRDSRRAQRELERNRRTTFLLSVVVIIFAVSWLPLGLFSLVSELLSNSVESSHSLLVVLAVCHLVAMSSAISNPVMYGWMNSNIRQELRQLLPRKWAIGGGLASGHEVTTTRTALHTTHVTNHRDCHESITLLVTNKEKQPPPRGALLTEL